MWDDIQPKPKVKPYRKILVKLVIAVVMGIGGYGFLVYASVPHSEVALLDWNGSGEKVETLLLEHVPLGTRRAVVETFIAEHLQRSEVFLCHRTTQDGICLKVFGTAFLCNSWTWYISFYFENERLSEISVDSGGICL